MTKSISIEWNDKDVYQRAKEIGIVLDDTQVSNILDSILESHDSNHGITWDTVEDEIYLEVDV